MRTKKLKLTMALGCFLLLTGPSLFGDTYTVINTDDSGDGSLRQAIIHANEHPGPDEIVFHIPMEDPGYRAPDGVWTIQPVTDLPTVYDHELTIDGATQAAFIGTETNPEGPEIEIDGSLMFYSIGLYIKGNGTSVYGLVINRFSRGPGVAFEGVDRGRISDCFIGTDSKGMLRASNQTGIGISSHSEFVEIIPRLDKFNIISGNPNAGIIISDSSSHNRIEGNRIGVNRTGQDTLGNGTHNGYGGVFISDESDSNQVINNWIGGNKHAGVYISISSNNTIAGNLIGTSEGWNLNLGNIYYGVWIRSYSYDTGVCMGNQIIDNNIGYNGTYGVLIEYERCTGNRITENRISDNTDFGIGLFDGANATMASPVILTATGTEITGQAGANQIIEIFCDDQNEGKIFLGKTISDGTGHFQWTQSSILPLAFITATATDINGNTSMFSDPWYWTGVHENNGKVRPKKFGLGQNFPNPFNLCTKIDYFLPEAGFVTLKIFDLHGRQMATLIQEHQPSGLHSIPYNAREMNSGIYYYQMEFSDFRLIRKMIFLK